MRPSLRALWMSPLTLALLALLAAPAAAESKQVWSVQPEKGFIDDPVALSSDDSRLAYIHTDSATFLNLVLVKTDGFAREKEIKIETASVVPRKLVFTPDDKRLILIWMDGYKGTYGAMVFEVESGKLVKTLGPTTRVELAPVGGEQALSLIEVKTDKRGNKNHTITLLRTKDLKRLKVLKLRLGADNTMARPPVRVLYWEPGYLSLVGMMKGKYDPKRDIRLPEKAVRYDLLQRKVVWSEAPQKLMKWTLATNMRPNHPGQFRFLEVSDDLKTLYHVDRNNALGEVTTPVRWGLYEPKSLKQFETWDGGQFFFSMTVDPVNPEAVKRKKADPERMDLYSLDKEGKPTPLGQVLTNKRRFGWAVGKTHFTYLKKLKGFGRGGKELSVYSLDK